MKRIAQSLITAVLLSSLTLLPANGLEYSDPNYSECSQKGSVMLYAQFVFDFSKFTTSKNPKTKKQKLEYKKLSAEQKRLVESFQVYNSDVNCFSLTVSQWLSIREDRLNALKTAEEYIIKMMSKYPFTKIQCFKNGIPQDVVGINPVCPKGFKQI
jgi:ribosomal protein L33